MKLTTITGNGDFPLSLGLTSNSKEVSVYADSSLGGATLTIGWLNSAKVFNPYLNGLLLDGESIRVRCGSGVEVVANVTGYTAGFTVGYAN